MQSQKNYTNYLPESEWFVPDCDIDGNFESFIEARMFCPECYNKNFSISDSFSYCFRCHECGFVLKTMSMRKFIQTLILT